MGPSGNDIVDLDGQDRPIHDVERDYTGQQHLALQREQKSDPTLRLIEFDSEFGPLRPGFVIEGFGGLSLGLSGCQCGAGSRHLLSETAKLLVEQF